MLHGWAKILNGSHNSTSGTELLITALSDLPLMLLTQPSNSSFHRALGTWGILDSSIFTIPKHTLFCALAPIMLCPDYLLSAHQGPRYSNQNSSTAPLVLGFESSRVFFWHSCKTYPGMCFSLPFHSGQESVLLVWVPKVTSTMLQTQKRQKRKGRMKCEEKEERIILLNL